MSSKTTTNDLRKVFSGSLWQAQIIQGLLEANNIVSMLDNETLSAVTAPYATLGGEVFVLVNSEDEEVASNIIESNYIASVPYN